eukprot:721779-Amorphochlora_amoeboformis.AAC.2
MASTKTHRYPASRYAYRLKEEIGRGGNGVIHRAVVCDIDWKTFQTEATKLGVSAKAMRLLMNSNYRKNPKTLLDHSRTLLTKLLGEELEGNRKAKSIASDIEPESSVERVIRAISAAKTETKAEVAVKIMNSANLDVEEIHSEIASMRALSHPNVIQIHAAFLHQLKNCEELWIVMPLELCSCYSLLVNTFPEGIKDPKILATILRQALRGIEYLHASPRMHRDIKASNLLLSKIGHVKLADFGACRDEESTHTFVGTYYWMAPEVIEQKHAYNNKADIWSFGITALELAYGKAPYADLPPMKALVNILKLPPPKAESSYDDFEKQTKLPKSFHRLVAACLKTNPSDRPTAKRLLHHAFFRNARNSDLLRQTVIDPILLKSSLYPHHRDPNASTPLPSGKSLIREEPNRINRALPCPLFNLPPPTPKMKCLAPLEDRIPSDMSLMEEGDDKVRMELKLVVSPKAVTVSSEATPPALREQFSRPISGGRSKRKASRRLSNVVK